MTAHDLAKLLLEGPDHEVSIKSSPDLGWVHAITAIKPATYLPYEEADRENTIVLVAHEGTLNSDEDLTFDDQQTA